MSKSIHIILLILVNSIILAQDKTFNNWHFGLHNIMSFNTTPPSLSINSGMYNHEGCSSISDTAGNTLFYTNGVEVYNRLNVQMPNGFGLNGHTSSTCSGLIVPVPYNQKKYYIFTTDAQAGKIAAGINSCGCLCYSVIDMNLNGGLGAVTVKNVVLFDSVTEKITGYWHQNDSAVWLVAHEWKSNHFLSYSITPSGVSPVPVVSAIGSVHTGGNVYNENAIGQMKISPDGTKIACVKEVNSMLELFKFDNSNGIISSPLNVALKPYYNLPYGLEFSPNSNYLYMSTVTGNSYLVQYNLNTWNASTISASGVELQGSIMDYRMLGGMQLGPDKKIYLSNVTGISGLSVINYPDSSAANCGFVYDQVRLTSTSTFGLPGHIPFRYTYKDIKDSVDYIPSVPANCDTPIIPNIITPNNDGTNDEFKITCNGSFEIPEDLIIYNRWGQEVYNNKKKDSLNKLTDGTYYYLFSFREVFYKGFVTVLH
jgi:hypothetical protein